MYFYPKIFDNADVSKENWFKFKIETYNDPSEISFSKAFLPLLIFNLALIGLGWMNFRKSKNYFF
ncbi:hypothetical protein ASC72_08950 [Flavobacterium sp. Root420]|nr:hypothetical protein ASC72_08950 [Flavobacterium sp. Root420]